MVECAHCVIFLQVMHHTLSRLSRRAMSRQKRANLKFLAKLGKTPFESFAMLQQVYGEEMMSRTRAFEWHKRFKERREEVEDDPWSGRPSTSRTADNIERVKQMVRADCRLTVRMIAEELSINKDTVWSIITKKISKCARCAQRWSPSCCPRTRNSKESLSLKTLSSASRTIQTCSHSPFVTVLPLIFP